MERRQVTDSGAEADRRAVEQHHTMGGDELAVSIDRSHPEGRCRRRPGKEGEPIAAVPGVQPLQRLPFLNQHQGNAGRQPGRAQGISRRAQHRPVRAPLQGHRLDKPPHHRVTPFTFSKVR
ncbi:hypothetical protein [Azospirillum lipoferum]|uniref:hypothetical protein n=1 Tax=Azospirillum lipoferum TaxID=193 RepID=UPI001395D421|nr:hypothetical protein [Azospirillum lipoferum]